MEHPKKEQKSCERHLKLAGCHNLRELGGYTTSDGKQIRWHTLLRSDSLHRLPLSSQQTILDYGVKTIIDLRTSSEVNQEPYALSKSSTVEYLNLPLVEDEHYPQLLKKRTLFEHNCFFLEERSQQIRTILEAIATNQTAVVIHCAAGKDRTGIIIALLLAIANVPIATIAGDYKLSDRYLAYLYADIREQTIKEGFVHLLASPPETILETFSYLDERYGGINGYLQTIGISSDQLDHLSRILIKK